MSIVPPQALFSNPDDPHKLAQCANLIMTRIRNGYQDGEWLPTIAQLAVESGISDTTVYKALRELEDKGLVSRIEGRGFYVGAGDPDKRTAELLPELIQAMSPDKTSQVLKVLADKHPSYVLRAIRYAEWLRRDTEGMPVQVT